MSAKIKFFLVFISTLLLFLLAQYYGQQYILRNSFKEIEAEVAKEKVNQVLSLVHRELVYFDQTCNDWSRSKAMSSFNISPATEFLDNNFSVTSFTDHNVDFGQVLDHKGSVVWEYVSNDYSALGVPFLTLLHGNTQNNNLSILSPKDPITSVLRSEKRLLLIDGNVAMISSCPIFDNPVAGTLVLGRYLSDKYIQKLIDSVGFEFYLTTSNCSKTCAITDHIVKSKLVGGPIAEPINTDCTHVYGACRDIHNKPMFYVTVQMGQTITDKGNASFVTVMIVTIACGIAVLLISLVAFACFISRPMKALSNYTSRVSCGEKLKQTGLDLKLPNELKILAGSFDKALHLFVKRKDELESTNEKLKEFAEIDALTQLANRRVFDERLAFELNKIKSTNATLSLILCDVDSFKMFNDTYGHLAGDGTLRDVASVMRNNVHRSDDLVARYGGEEFVILLPGTIIEHALIVAEKLRDIIEKTAIPHTVVARKVITMSFGVASTSIGGESTPESLIDAADKALYHAKNCGRNMVVSAG